MNARSALFDVYGDHLLARDGVAPIAGLVSLMSALDIAPPAVRTAVSRMVSQDWLEPVKLDTGAGYRLTPRAKARLRDAAERIYRSAPTAWDGRWHLVSLDRIAERARRERVRSALTYLGYAQLRDQTWISPHPSPELAAALEAEGTTARRFSASFEGANIELTASAWDLDALSTDYTQWLAEARVLIERRAALTSDRDAYVTRTSLVHEWRKFLFRDPGLPRELLPTSWPGDVAAEYFDAEAARLLPGASRYVDACLAIS